MGEPMTLTVDALTRADVPDAMTLSTQAGWNQLPADWHRLLTLAPDGCIAGRVDGNLVATGTLITYGTVVGWIGMILVDPDHRRQGYGMTVFDRVLELAEEQGVIPGLDATDAGRKVYRQRDFLDVSPIERWGGTLSIPDERDGQPDTAVVEVGPDDQSEIETLCALDRRATSTDRSALLRHLIGEDGTTALLVSGGRGYAIVRPGRKHEHIGPLVADDETDAAALVVAACNHIDGSVLVDVLDVEFAESVLAPSGLKPQRHLTRMAASELSPLLVGDGVRLAAGFELG